MKFTYFSEHLRAALPASGYEIDQFAAMLGYKSAVIVGMWLSGEHGPRLEQLAKIAGVLGVDVSFLLADWMADMHPEFRPQMQAMLAGQGLAVPSYERPPQHGEDMTSAASDHAPARFRN